MRRDYWNVFDFFIVLSSVVALAVDSSTGELSFVSMLPPRPEIAETQSALAMYSYGSPD
jgi:hypothetical protein